MFGRSGVEKNALNRKPERVNISVSLKKAKQFEDEESVETSSKYKITPRTSLKLTSNFIKSTMKTLSADTANVYDVIRKSCNEINSVSKAPIQDSRYRERAFAKSLNTIPEQTRINKKKAEIIAKLTQCNNKIIKLDKNKTNQVDLERMCRLGLALDWNSTNRNESNPERLLGKVSDNNTTSFCEELECIKSSLKDKRVNDDKERDNKIQKTTLEMGWINFGNKRNEYRLPHKYVCPYETCLENKQGKIDGLVTLHELADYAYKNTKDDDEDERNSENSNDMGPNAGYHLQQTSYVTMKCNPNHNDYEESNTTEEQLSPKSSEHTRYYSIKNSEENAQEVWKEKTNRWINNNNSGNACYEILTTLTEEEMLTRSWKESLSRWNAEKKDLLNEAAKNHYDIGRRILSFKINSQKTMKDTQNLSAETKYELNKDEIDNSISSFALRNAGNSSKTLMMSKNDVKKFCSYWDSTSAEMSRNALLTKFLELYAGKDRLDTDAIFCGGDNLLFMRFCFGFKVSLKKKQRVWKYIECLLVFLSSIHKQVYLKALMDINFLEDILEIVKLDEIHLFDKLQSLYLLNTLIEDSKAHVSQEMVETISCNEKYMTSLLHFFILCEDPQTLIISRNVLLNIIDRTDVSTSRFVLRTISELAFSECAPCNVEMIFQILRFIALCHPSIVDLCGEIVLNNLNTQDCNLMLQLGELAITMMKSCRTDRNRSCLVIKGIFDKAVNPFLIDESLERNAKDNTVIERDNSNGTSLKSDKELKALGDDLQETTQQVAALFVINYILENRDPTSVPLLLDLGVVGLSLIATGQKFVKAIQDEGIRLIKTLNQVNFECGASYTLLLSEDILCSILNKRAGCFQNISSETLLCVRKLGYGMLKNWNLWIAQIIAPTKRELKEDYEMAMSRTEDYTVTLKQNVSNGKNCREIVDNALKVPIGQYVAEILHKLKTLWRRDLELKKRDHENYESCDEINSDSLDWINSTESETESHSLNAPPPQYRNINSYLTKDSDMNTDHDMKINESKSVNLEAGYDSTSCSKYTEDSMENTEDIWTHGYISNGDNYSTLMAHANEEALMMRNIVKKYQKQI